VSHGEWKKPLHVDFGNNPYHVILGLVLQSDGHCRTPHGRYVLSGICLIVTILWHQRPCWRYALYWVPFMLINWLKFTA